MTSENIKKLIEVEQKARELVENARNERDALRKSARRDAEVIAASIKKKYEDDLLILEKKYEKELKEETEKARAYYESKIRHIKEIDRDMDELVDKVVKIISGDDF
ncbi:hypothetical protein DMUE_0654 [Dictyocoela muelleri]|nr:hypothetical protein DMUE_0654 [Dictyocoela muelleri]